MPTVFTQPPSVSPPPHFLRHLFAALAYKPSTISFENQRKKEEIILLMRRHWITNIGWLLLTLLLLLLPLVFPFLSFLNILPARYRFLLTLVWYLLTFAFFLENFLNWYFNVYIVTNQRLIDVDFYSLVYKEVSDTPLENIQDMTYSMGGLIRALFNYGDILIQTAAEKQQFEFQAIPKPAWVVEKINQLITKNKHHPGNL